MNELFGELRAMLSARAGDVDREWSDALYALIERAAASDERCYQEQWVPYLSAYPSFWDRPLKAVHGVDAYREAVALAPFARFALSMYCSLDDESHGVIDLGELLDFRGLERVFALELEVDGVDVFTGLGYGDCTVPEYLVSVGFKGARLESLKTLKLLGRCVLDGHRASVLSGLDMTALPRLERIEIEGSGEGLSDGVLLLLSSQVLNKIKELRITNGIRFMPDELSRLPPFELRKLEVLELPNERLSDEGMAALLRLGLPALRVLDVSDGELTGLSVEVLARSPILSSLEELDLSAQQGLMALGPLLRSPALEALRTLRVTKPNRERLQDEPHDHDVMPSRLGRKLTIRVDKQEDASSLLNALSSAEAPFRLELLSLDQCLLSVDELDVLLHAHSLVELEYLGLVLPHEPEAQLALMERLARHHRPWRALCLRGFYGLCEQAREVLLREAAFEELQWLELCLEGYDDGPLLSVLTSYPRLRGLSLDGVVSPAAAQLLVNELKQLQWLDIWTGDDVVLDCLARSVPIQDALRAANRGHLCRYHHA